jgi:hypothetical protein
MSRCLNEYEIQAIADNEAPAEHHAHLGACAACAGRVAARRRLTERAVAAAGSIDMSDTAHARMRTRIVDAPARGATTLRAVRKPPRWAWGVPLAAAVALLSYFVVVPGIDRQTTVSAAEVLGRSQAALSAPVSGVEVLTYDLDLEGVLGDLVPAEQAGRFTVEELIDHDHDGRYRIVKLAADGRIVGGVADDTVGGTRVRYVRVNGRGFLLRFSGAAPAALSVVALKRSALQIFLGLMQTSTTQTLRDVERAGEHCYEISIPGVTVPATSLVALDRARAVVAASDARLVEFSAAGRVSGKPFTMDFILRSREIRPSGSAVDGDFDIAAEPGDVVLQGDATTNPLWDVLTRVLDAIPASAAVRH